jgi:hypothetical protein
MSDVCLLRFECRPSFQSVLKSLQTLLKHQLEQGVPDTAGRSVDLKRLPVSGSLF